MSDHHHVRITEGLRKEMRRRHKFSDLPIDHVELDSGRFDALCDNIDVLYGMLEAENESLRKKLSGATKVGRLELSVHVDLEQMAVELERAADAIRSLAGDDE